MVMVDMVLYNVW